LSSYNTFLIDIYATRSLTDFVDAMGKSILHSLKPFGKKVMDAFISNLASLKAKISYDSAGIPSWSMEIGEISSPKAILDEIFSYLESARRQCIVAIDEFQQVTKYTDGSDMEALLRTYIQNCHNAVFIFMGSSRTMMGEMFSSASRPFFQAATMMGLSKLDKDVYADFVIEKFAEAQKAIDRCTVQHLYDEFDGFTLPMQKTINVAFSMTDEGEVCGNETIESAINFILDLSDEPYTGMLYALPQKQKDLLYAIASEKKARKITSGAFSKKHSLTSPSAVMKAAKALEDKDIICKDADCYQVYDGFLQLWIERKVLG